MDRSTDVRRMDSTDAAAASGRLTHLGDLKEFKVADGDPDIRGWSVKTSDGVKLGKVADLLVDAAAMKARYMELSLDKGVLDIEEDRHVLVPIGAARLVDDDEIVMVNRTAGDLIAMPEYQRGTITVNDERVLYDRYGRGQSTGDPADLYGDEHFDDSRLLSDRTERDKDSGYIVRVKEYVVRDDEVRKTE